jgi:predicted nucleic acid-binding protein
LWRRFSFLSLCTIHASNDVMRAWRDVLAVVPHECVEVDEVIDQVGALMTTHGLQSYDAVHIATALRSGVKTVVTLDAGFASVPQSVADLYVDASRLAPCRRRRAR